MKLIAPGIIVRKFRESDENTIIRLPNLRRFVKNNNIKYIMVGRNWLIDGDRFMKVINPSKIDCRYEIPKIRTLRSAIKEFKSRYIYKKTIRPELIAEIVKTENITAYYMGNKRL